MLLVQCGYVAAVVHAVAVLSIHAVIVLLVQRSMGSFISKFTKPVILKLPGRDY